MATPEAPVAATDAPKYMYVSLMRVFTCSGQALIWNLKEYVQPILEKFPFEILSSYPKLGMLDLSLSDITWLPEVEHDLLEVYSFGQSEIASFEPGELQLMVSWDCIKCL